VRQDWQIALEEGKDEELCKALAEEAKQVAGNHSKKNVNSVWHCQDAAWSGLPLGAIVAALFFAGC
jgi:hypothetical protein